MKVLEILNKFSKIHESAHGFNGVMVASLGDIHEAIEELKSLQTCNKCVYAIHCEETDEYGYNHKDQNCKDCYRSGWTDNYNTGEQK